MITITITIILAYSIAILGLLAILYLGWTLSNRSVSKSAYASSADLHAFYRDDLRTYWRKYDDR
jgi:hypothetical protein